MIHICVLLVLLRNFIFFSKYVNREILFATLEMDTFKVILFLFLTYLASLDKKPRNRNQLRVPPFYDRKCRRLQFETSPSHWGEPLHKSTIWYNSKILRHKCFINAIDSKNSENPENVESGSKSGSGIPGKKFSQKIFLLDSEQFLLMAFFKKMVISAKKVCFLHFSYLPASAR